MAGNVLLRAMCFIALFGFVFCKEEPLRVAIVGSGIGGASTTFFLHELLGSGVNVTVFEKDKRIGGRMKHLDYEGGVYEVGASIVYDGNFYVKSMVEKLGLKSIKPLHMDGRMGIWDGEQFVFEQTGWKTVDIAKMVWLYGYGALQAMKGIVYDMLARFNRIYDVQRGGLEEGPVAFESWDEMWGHLDLLALMQMPFSRFLVERMGEGGADEGLGGEVIQAVNRVNYNQGNGLNALAGSVSLCPLVTGTLFCVEGGNSQLSTSAFAYAQANVHWNARVESVEVIPPQELEQEQKEDEEEQQEQEEGQPQQKQRRGWKDRGVGGGEESTAAPLYRLQLDSRHYGGTAAAAAAAAAGPFDAVVVATPLESDMSGGGIEFEGFQALGAVGGKGGGGQPQLPPRDFQITHSTFVRGKLRAAHFGVEDVSNLPDSILTIGTGTLFSSVSIQARYDEGQPFLYKVFSRAAFTTRTLATLFEPGGKIVTSMRWRGYPKFQPPEALAPLRLFPGHGVLYLNGVETAASALEISAIAGRNLALLLQRQQATGIQNQATLTGANKGTAQTLLTTTATPSSPPAAGSQKHQEEEGGEKKEL